MPVALPICMLDLAIYLGNNEDAITTLALAMDLAMMADEAAQTRYLAIYGVAWTPVTESAIESMGRSKAARSFTTTIVG